MKNNINNYVIKVIYPEIQKVQFVRIDKSGVSLTDDLEDANRFSGDIEDGHGSPNDWAKMFSEDYHWKYCELMKVSY